MESIDSLRSLVVIPGVGEQNSADVQKMARMADKKSSGGKTLESVKQFSNAELRRVSFWESGSECGVPLPLSGLMESLGWRKTAHFDLCL